MSVIVALELALVLSSRHVFCMDFHNWIEDKENDLLTIRDRLALLIPLEKTLQAHAKSGKVMVRNWALYRMALDSYGMLVIDLASFFTGLLRKGSGLNQLNNHLSSLGRPKRKAKDKSHLVDDDDTSEIQFGARQDAFLLLFPSASGERPTQDDVRALKTRIASLSQDCKTLRDNFHAHKYEKDNKNEPHAHLQLAEIRKLMDQVEETFNALRLLALDSTMHYSTPSDESETASDLRDLIIHGSANTFCAKIGVGTPGGNGRYYWELRDSYYSGEAWQTEVAGWNFGSD